MSDSSARPRCSCGHDRYHHAARATLRHSAFGWVLLFMGISAEPKEITFRCAFCGEQFEKTSDPVVMREFRRYPYVTRREDTASGQS